MELKDFLELEPEQQITFDFKNLMEDYYRRYEKNHRGDLEYQALIGRLEELHTENSIEKWFLYRTLDDDLNKSIRRFDCDSWNDTCELTSQIYQTLWPASCVQSSGVRFGGDTMNSFAHLFNRLADRGSFRESYVRYKSNLEGFQTEADKILSKLARNTGCLGNFTLVPHGFNCYRGHNGSGLDDFFDLSLMELKDNEAKWFGPGGGGAFTQYVNLFFLWDYTETKGEEYMVKPFFDGHTKERLYPADDDEWCDCIKAINTNIRQRGKFMAEMLRIATFQPERYKKIQAYLSDPALRFDSTEAAGRKIKEIIPPI